MEIRIKGTPGPTLLQIETDLVQAFGLQDAIVIPTDSADVSPPISTSNLGMAAAQFPSTRLPRREISWPSVGATASPQDHQAPPS